AVAEQQHDPDVGLVDRRVLLSILACGHVDLLVSGPWPQAASRGRPPAGAEDPYPGGPRSRRGRPTDRRTARAGGAVRPSSRRRPGGQPGSVTAEHAAFAASVDPALYSVVAAEPTTEPEVRVLGVPGPVLEALRAAASSHVIPGARRWWVTGDRSMTAVHGAGTPHVAGPVAAATRVAAGAAVLSVRLAVA